MVRIVGKLIQDDEEGLCIEMRISPQNPELFNVPLTEVFEELIGKKIVLEALPLVEKESDGGKK
jgi:hypothetical protein